MGTNYTWHYNACDKCGREDVLHIGKLSCGWSFGFRGYRSMWEPIHILSFKDWKTLFAAGGGHIENEDGDHISVEDFCALVEDSRGGESHMDYCRVHHPSCLRDLWKDEDGNDFQEGEFS